MSWCSDAPEDQRIFLFAGLLVNPDVSLRINITPFFPSSWSDLMVLYFLSHPTEPKRSPNLLLFITEEIKGEINRLLLYEIFRFILRSKTRTIDNIYRWASV